MKTRRPTPGEARVEFKAADAKSKEEYSKQRALQIVTVRNVRAGEELFVDYNMRYLAK